MIKRETLEPLSKDQIIDFFVEFSNKVEQLNEMREDIRVLKEENQRLKSQNSRNSSRPPSHDLGRTPRQKSLRQPSNKKSGGQKGHKGITLFQSSDPEIIKHTPNASCPACGKIHSVDAFKLQSKRQVVSFVSYLSTRQYIPLGRLPELLKCIYNVSLSGESYRTIYNMLNRVADNLLPVYEGIKQNVANATVIGSDESGVKVNSGKYWTWTWQPATETFITITPSRGYVTIENEFPNGFPEAIFVSDSLSAQLKTPAL